MRKLALLSAALGVISCDPVGVPASGANEGATFSLVRSSTAAPMRIHVATFDANVGGENENRSYNSENCEIAKNLFESQQGVRVLYACEEGRFNK